MGCDIHLSAERRNKHGYWLVIENPLRECWSCKGAGVLPDDGNTKIEYVGKPCYWCKGEGKKREEFYEGRNYDLFAILANVRNGRGFAGVVTGDGFVPIAMPRGLPEDVSDEVSDASERWGADGHSHSWLTLAELDAYDWTQTTKHRGVLSMDEYKKWVAAGASKSPESYCGDVSGGLVVKVTRAVMDDMIRNDTDTHGKHYYTAVEWTETYRESAGDAFFKSIDELRAFGNPEDVRIVFWFDN